MATSGCACAGLRRYAPDGPKRCVPSPDAVIESSSSGRSRLEHSALESFADDTPSPGTIRFAQRNDDDYFYPDVSYAYDPQKVLWKKEKVWNERSQPWSA